jgi:hypothetical protein
MWYNNKTNELQSDPPYLGSYMDQDLVIKIYSDWTQVAEDFIPPVPELSPEEKRNNLILALNAEYEGILSDLEKSFVAALMNGDTSTQADIKAEKAAVVTSYQEQLAIINTGGGEGNG